MSSSIADEQAPDGRDELLAELDRAVTEHVLLAQRWNRTLICDGAMPHPDDLADDSHHRCQFGSWLAVKRHFGLVDQPAMHQLAVIHENLHTTARRLLTLKASEVSIEAEEYDRLTNRLSSFIAQCRRMDRAFRTAMTDMDPLTGAYNRQSMLGDLERERERALRSETPTVIALTDIDKFKRVNDTYGHSAGDQVLQVFAGVLQSNVRPFDRVFRYGGEEFLICLPNAEVEEAKRVLERLREAVQDTPVALPDGQSLSITSSFGAAPVTKFKSLNETIELADKALYAAKEAGRNRVKVYKIAKPKTALVPAESAGMPVAEED